MEHIRQRYLGKCGKCGCEFRTILTIEIDNEGHKSIKPVEYLNNLTMSEDGKSVTCDCPACNKALIELNEI